MFISTSDDGHYKIWDVRSLGADNKFVHCYKDSDDELGVGSFSQLNEYLYSTGGELSGVIHIWDLRMTKYFINDLCFHKEKVN
jgi:WD40 repeat protein